LLNARFGCEGAALFPAKKSQLNVIACFGAQNQKNDDPARNRLLFFICQWQKT
jgi:hypothetical protein